MHPRDRRWIVAIIWLSILLCSRASQATSFAPPKRHSVSSPNGGFVLDVNPDTRINTLYSAADKRRPLWSFTGLVWLEPILVSNDGKVVVRVASPYVEDQDIAGTTAVEFLNRDGVVQSYTLSDLCPRPAKTSDVGVGPVGDFWRTWHTKVEQDGERIWLTTAEGYRGYRYEFRMSDGQVLDKRLVLAGVVVPRSLGTAAGFAILFSILLAFWCWRRRRRAQLVGLVPRPTLPLPPRRKGV